MGGDPPAALQDWFDFFRAATELGNAFAPVVAGFDVAVERLLAGGGDGGEAVDPQLIGRDLAVGRADAAHLGDVLVVGDADGEPPSQPVHRADKAAQLALAEVAGGDVALCPCGRGSVLSEVVGAMTPRPSEIVVAAADGGGPSRRRVASAAAGRQ